MYVTGVLGSAAAGLALLKASDIDVVSGFSRTSPDACVERYLRPDPRVRMGMLLGRNRAASSCMDLSDGLADAVRQIAEASGAGVTIDTASLPIDGDLEHAISAGDDYELLFTSRPSQRGRLRNVRRQAGDLPITKIGVVTKGTDVLLRDERGTREMPRGYEHFGSSVRLQAD